MSDQPIHDTNDFTNDPRLTAYALGELEGAELAEVEAILAKDEASRRAVDEIRAAATLVTAGLLKEGGAASVLAEAQRAAITAKAADATPVLRMRPIHWFAAAASVAAAVTIVASSRSTDEARMQETAKGEQIALKAQIAATGEPVPPGYQGPAGEIPPDSRAPVDAPEGGSAKRKFDDASKSLARADATLKQLEKQSEKTLLVVPEGKPANERRADDLSRELHGVGGGAGGGNGAIGASPKVPEPAKPSSGPMPAGGERVGGLGQKGGGGGGGGRAGDGKSVGRTARDGSEIVLADPPAPPVSGGPATPDGGGGPSSGGGGDSGGAGGPSTGGGGAPAPGRVLAERERVKREVDSLDKNRDGTWDSVTEFRRSRDSLGTETYAHVEDNPFRLVKDSPLSTFGVDVDTASYANVRRFLASNRLPPPGAVRIEEMVNYFPYDYAPPTDGRPFAVRVDVAGCPWQTDHRLVRVGIKGKIVETAARPAANLVFLIDVSGSMNSPDKLPLLVQSMKLMTEQLGQRDRVAMVVYAGTSGLVLPSTECSEKEVILAALDRLRAGGSTNGGAGIQLAYDTAMANRIEGGINRVILATDGDFNVGVVDESSLVRMIEEKAKSGVFLSVLGFGTGNLKDAQMEKLADRGNGNYAYVDTLKEGKKALVDQMSGTLVAIAKDVKLQIEFNPSQVGAYRLIGYENRVLAAEDFKDDRKDAGEIGAGHTVTALYEIVSPGVLTQTAGVDPLKYQQPHAGPRTIEGVDAQSLELLTVKLRWKEPNSDVSTPMEVPVVDEGMSYSSASPDFKFAASVAAFGMLLRNSPHRGQANYDAILELAMEGVANDPNGYRKEFVEMVSVAKRLTGK